jgi:hypothetical protein
MPGADAPGIFLAYAPLPDAWKSMTKLKNIQVKQLLGETPSNRRCCRPIADFVCAAAFSG